MTVAATLIFKSTSTGDELWKYSGTVVLNTSGSLGGGGIAGLIANVVVTAIKTASSDYVPIARQVSYTTVSSMPYGKYNPQRTQDGGQKIIMQTPKATQTEAQ